MKKFLSCCAAVWLCCSGMPAAESIQIQNIRIVTAEKASGIEKSAAGELSRHLGKIYSSPAEINGQKAETATFYVGLSPEAVAAGFINLPAGENLPGKFGVFRRGNNFLFYGYDTPNGDIYTLKHNCGTLLAVEYFLQKYLNVKFFLPGDEGVKYTRDCAIIFPAMQDLPKPSYESRGFQSAGKNVDKKSMMLFFRRRLGQVPEWSIRDYYYQIYNKWNKRFKDKPEMFALHNNKRINAKYPLHFPCTSNPAVVKQVIDDVRYVIKKRPSTKVIRFFCDAPVKGCECAECTGSPAGKLTRGADYSETVYAFFSQIGNTLVKDHPGLYFHIQTKGRHYYRPPQTEKLPPNTVVWVLTGHFLAPEYPAVREICANWKKAGARILLHCYPRPPGMKDFPLMNPHRIAEHFKQLQGAAAGLVRSEGGGKVPYSFSALNNYVQSAIMFDTSLDVEKIIDEFCSLAAPDAAEELRKFYDAMEGLLEGAGFWDEPLFNCYARFRLETPRRLLNAAVKKAPANKFLQQLSKDFAHFEKQSDADIPNGKSAEYVRELYRQFSYRQDPVKLTAAGETLKLVPFAFYNDFQPGTVTLAGTGNALKLKFVCQEKVMDKFSAAATSENKLSIWNDDTVEIFIASPGRENPHIQLVGNAGGCYQAFIRNDRGVLEPQEKFPAYCKGSRNKDSWSIEWLIPFSQLEKFKVKDTVAMAIYRSRPARGGDRVQQSGVQKPLAGGYKSLSGRFSVELSADKKSPKE